MGIILAKHRAFELYSNYVTMPNKKSNLNYHLGLINCAEAKNLENYVDFCKCRDVFFLLLVFLIVLRAPMEKNVPPEIV